MISICLVLRAHEPWLLRPYNYFDVGRSHDYFDAGGMRRRIARRDSLFYGPATELLAGLLERHRGFRFGLALSGPFLEQLDEVVPARIAALRRLVETGRAEPLSATSHHCLPWPVSAAQLESQLERHRGSVRRAVGREPSIFGGEQPSNAEALAKAAESTGLSAMILETSGAADMVPPRSIHRAARSWNLRTIWSDARLSRDLVRRLSAPRSALEPSPTSDLDSGIQAAPGDLVCLSLDLSEITRRQPLHSSAIEPFEVWVSGVLSHPQLHFTTPSEALAATRPQLDLTMPVPGANPLQQDALEALASLEGRIRDAAGPVLEDFRRLTGSNHLRDMSLRAGARVSREDAFDSPYEAYMAFRHAVTDLEGRLPLWRPEIPVSRHPASA